MSREGLDHTEQLYSPIWVFTVQILQNQPFLIFWHNVGYLGEVTESANFFDEVISRIFSENRLTFHANCLLACFLGKISLDCHCAKLPRDEQRLTTEI